MYEADVWKVYTVLDELVRIPFIRMSEEEFEQLFVNEEKIANQKRTRVAVEAADEAMLAYNMGREIAGVRCEQRSLATGRLFHPVSLKSAVIWNDMWGQSTPFAPFTEYLSAWAAYNLRCFIREICRVPILWDRVTFLLPHDCDVEDWLRNCRVRIREAHIVFDNDDVVQKASNPHDLHLTKRDDKVLIMSTDINVCGLHSSMNVPLDYSLFQLVPLRIVSRWFAINEIIMRRHFIDYYMYERKVMVDKNGDEHDIDDLAYKDYMLEVVKKRVRCVEQKLAKDPNNASLNRSKSRYLAMLDNADVARDYLLRDCAEARVMSAYSLIPDLWDL